jgi:hypothetical protein
MGHFVPLAEGVDAGAAGFVEAGGVEDPLSEVGVGGVALTLCHSHRGRGEEGIGARIEAQVRRSSWKRWIGAIGI